jgi:outer membrane protein OmpA-like peptidoglycan-associated protein
MSRRRTPCPGRDADAPRTSSRLVAALLAAVSVKRIVWPASVAVALALAAAAGLVGAAAPASASNPFPVEETFKGSTFGSQWRHGGSAQLTRAKEEEGWLRLTSAETGEFGYAYDNEAFPSTAGVLVEFEYADWGGSGADGLTFFLFNGSTSEAEFQAGQPGGSLGYAPCDSKTNGLSNAYVGVGFDEYGNFTNLGSICGLDGTEFLPNHVSIRGSAAESYKLLATAQTTESLRAERSQARRVTIAITPTGELSVYIRYPDGTDQKVAEGFQLPAAPEKLKFGYVASTGALTDDHEIRDAQVIKPTELTPSVTQTAGGHERGKPLTWTAVVRNEGPNPTQRERLRATTGEQSLSSVSWTCEASGGADCVTASGTGLPSLEAGAMPEGSGLTYKITGTPTPTTNYAQMTIESEPRGDTGELDPEKERASTKTNLIPLFDKEPSFALAADGEASATAASALGGEISYGYAWQRCETNGTACVDIPAAEATTYHTTSADAGHTIRFTETAANSAGTSTVDSPVYKSLPTAQITSGPAHYVDKGEAVLSFTASTKEATLECSLDGGAWTACTSPKSYSGLADGEHTFSVRAAYGGLSNPDPSSLQWTVEATPPPAPIIVSAPSSPSAQASPKFGFGELTEGDTLECSLDGGKWRACDATTEVKGLTDGEHQLQARQVNKAGVDSNVTSYTWTVDATRPAPPKLVAAPEPESAQSSVHFEFSHEQNTTVECSLDGGPYVECTSGISPTGLSEGSHTLTARQVSAAGLVSSTTTYKWRVVAKHAPAASTPRRAAKHKRRSKRRRHAAKPRHAAKRKPMTKARGPVAKVKTPAPAAARTPKKRTPAPAAAHTPKKKTPARGTAHEGKDEAPALHPAPPVHSKTHRPTAKHAPKVGTAPGGTTPASNDTAQAPVAVPGPKVKTRREAHAPAAGRKPKDKTPTPAVRTAPKGKIPAATPTAKDETPAPATTRTVTGETPAPATTRTVTGKTPAPAATRTVTGKTPTPAATRVPNDASGESRGVVANPLIWPFGPRSYKLVRRARRLVERVAATAAHARRIICVGYTDDLGDRSENLALGLKRARAVCAILHALGVHASLEAESRGEAEPRASNATPAGRALNRRVELRIAY